MTGFIPLKCYALTWSDTGTPYMDPDTRQAPGGLNLKEAMLIAMTEPVTVTDTRTGEVVWVGREPTRGGL